MDDLKADSKSAGVDNHFSPLHINTFGQTEENYASVIWAHLISQPLILLAWAKWHKRRHIGQAQSVISENPKYFPYWPTRA